MVWAGPSPNIRAGPESARPRKERGDYFPPLVLLHVERYEGGDEDEGDARGERKVTWRGGRGALADLDEDVDFIGGVVVATGGREREKESEDGRPLGRLVFLLSLDLDFSTLGA